MEEKYGIPEFIVKLFSRQYLITEFFMIVIALVFFLGLCLVNGMQFSMILGATLIASSLVWLLHLIVALWNVYGE